MNEENGTPNPPPSGGLQSSDKAIWVLAAFLPSVVAAILVVSLSAEVALSLRERNAALWLTLSACYLFGLEFAQSKKTKTLSFDFVGQSIPIVMALLTANLIVCGMLYFAGCVCAVSEISRINH